ncbi:hypothetical protein CDAR_193281 [Caerostris darwini]|uniref:C2H2-type domain-containing protein n=1 Tax=Caerostris darwini TaxID=1538125 RepID=A0AAV4QTT2_9ARAC|nr:hypothetical protein CDAR_193281 [Caerostris darwini]
MDITICEFCKSCITNFEVHNCFNLGNQHHQSYATIPQNSSANSAQNSDLITQSMDYEARWTSMGQMNFSMQQNMLPAMHQRTGYEEHAAAEMFSWYEFTKQNPFNPETSNFPFPGMPSIQENEQNTTHFQLPYEVSKVSLHQNSQNYEPINPEPPTDIPVFGTERSILSDSQQTFGQRNALMHQTAQNPNAFSQLECSGMCSTNELPPHFTSAYHNFGENDPILPNEISQYSEKSFEMPLFNIQNAQYSSCNPIHPTDSIEQTKIFPFTIGEYPSENVSLSPNSVSDNREENIFGTQYPNISDLISLPRASDISIDNKESREINLDTLKFKEGENSIKHKLLADLSYGVAKNISNPSNASQIHEFNLGIGMKSNKIEPRASEHLDLITCTSESHKACNISKISLVNESHATYKNYPEDMIFSKSANSSKNLEFAPEYARRQLYKGGKDRKSFLQPKDHPEFRDRSCTIPRPNKNSLCDESYSKSFNLSKHFRPHTGNKPFQCTECGTCFAYRYLLRNHNKIHTAEKPYSCRECGKCFSTNGQLLVHFRTHTGEKPYSCTDCGKCFAANSNLRNHIRSTHTGETTYSCSECGKGYVFQSELISHNRIHTGEKPHSCTECGRCFAVRSNLSRHVRSTHSGEKPYTCHKCCKRYARNADLKHHKLKHVVEESRKCDFCAAEFSSEELLKAHQCGKSK